MNDKMTVLAKFAPEHHPRYTVTDIGNSNLFADYYRDIARYVPERKMWYIFTGKLWEPDIGNLQAMELCKKLADELVIYALSLPDGRDRTEYRKAVERWQIRHYREVILKDAMGIYTANLSDFDSKPYLFNCKNGTLDLHTRGLSTKSIELLRFSRLRTVRESFPSYGSSISSRFRAATVDKRMTV